MDASKLRSFSCSSSKEIGVSLAWTVLANSVYSEPSPSRIRSKRSSKSIGAPRMASSSARALMVCRNSETPRDPFDSGIDRHWKRGDKEREEYC
ncbi:hypothetical protein Peur_058872 [Populus x canadensis]